MRVEVKQKSSEMKHKTIQNIYKLKVQLDKNTSSFDSWNCLYFKQFWVEEVPHSTVYPWQPEMIYHHNINEFLQRLIVYPHLIVEDEFIYNTLLDR